MLVESLNSKFPKKGNKKYLHEKGLKTTRELFPNGGGPQDDLLYGFLCLILLIIFGPTIINAINNWIISF